MPTIRVYQGPLRKGQKRRARITGRKRRAKSVAAATKRNTKDIKTLKAVGFQYAPFIIKTAETVSAPVHTHLLTAPNNWQGVFRMNGVSNDDLPRQYNLKSVSINWFAQVESAEVGNLWVQMMVVSLKRRMAAQVIQRTTRLSNMEENLDYISQEAGTHMALQGDCGYKLNPALYTVHYNSGQRRIGESTMGQDEKVTNIRDSTTTGKCRVKFPRVFKNDETSDAGFKDLNYEQIEPRQHLYIIYFSNTSGDLVTGGELFTSHLVEFHGHCNNPN